MNWETQSNRVTPLQGDQTLRHSFCRKRHPTEQKRRGTEDLLPAEQEPSNTWPMETRGLGEMHRVPLSQGHLLETAVVLEVVNSNRVTSLCP